ncbi:glycosyltransferase family 2 protein [Stenotrophomonas maltophilia]|uniref:glycosyltransferase family 2 protein n=1 Tax=Stenotrophomonas maltophilia TaxID=40324 RepID=UPI000DA95F9D|nr:glycosyltransferase family 2 protein [Stenotrophomonas maltophilia]PZT02112.1 glycosyl transferase [Stenotrophomonas maltophilia]TIK66052.1 glycosyltransferase family 2 protein [Stenotrophomonas maltophilia]TIK71691.1 glycosyltransferase family 2 protein [Stenotrophomonas maltophilia]
MNAAIAAIVVTYQSGSTIDACLSRLRQAQDIAEIRVIDNGSLDGTLDIVQRHASHDPRVRFVGNPDNPGFAAANNQGVTDSHSPWLAFINPDLMIEPDTLTELRSRGEVLGDCLLGVEQVDEHGHADEAVRRRDPDFLLMLRSPGKGSKLAVPRDRHQAVQPVPALSGALLMMPRTLFERIGGWDAGYRLHAEDLDLCRRAREAGAVVAIANDLQVTHVRGVSSRSRPFFVEWHKHRGLWRYFQKFEAKQRSLPVRVAVWAAIWAHALMLVPRLLRRSL